jgi:uncharacterized protein
VGRLCEQSREQTLGGGCVSDLTTLASLLRVHPGIVSKVNIQKIARALGTESKSAWTPSGKSIKNGDDAAAIPDADGYILTAAEGIVPELVRNDPWFAGFCSVMVNVNDIAAMGGVPYAVTSVLFAGEDVDNERVLSGMLAASSAFGVPIVGGHTGHSAHQTWLSVSIVGRATHLLSSFDVLPGHVLVYAIDLRGAYRGNYSHFNAATNATSVELRRSVALLSHCAERGYAVAAKDVSQAGLVGTLTMLCESSRVGALLELDAIPKPSNVDEFKWLTTFPSFGFILACEPQEGPSLLRHFEQAGITAAVVGYFDRSRQVRIGRNDETAVVWDLEATPLTGFSGLSQVYEEAS